MEKDIAHVLVDLRDPKETEKGFIPGAVSIPANELAAAKDTFPADKSAPIILYANQLNEQAFKTVRNWGYKDTAVLSGGIDSWIKDGGKIEKGKPGSTIAYI